MIAMPDPSTFRMLPWQSGERSVARMICDVRTPDGDPYEADSRHVLRGAHRADAVARASTAFKIGPELEFFCFRLDEDGKPHTLDAGGYFEETTADAVGRAAQEDRARARGDGHPGRVPPPRGRARASTRSTCATPTASTMADHCITYRSMVKEVAKRNGVYATFMPKPLFGENGSGMHTHQSLFIGGSNAFFDADDRWYLSDVAKSFIAGQLRHAREISLLFAQWVEQLQAAGAGLRGAGVRRLVAAQPLGADPGAAVPPGQGEGDAGRDPLPRPVLQPVPGVRRRCCTPASRGSSAATSCPTRWRPTSTS